MERDELERENHNDRMAEMLKTAEVKTVSQDRLTSECWLVQIYGSRSCETCEVRDTEECGGKDIRKTGKNEKGYTVPLGN